MRAVYIVEAHGILYGYAVTQHFAVGANLFTNWNRLRKECFEDLQQSARFDTVLWVHLHISPRLTLMKYLNRRKFLKTLTRVSGW